MGLASPCRSEKHRFFNTAMSQPLPHVAEAQPRFTLGNEPRPVLQIVCLVRLPGPAPEPEPALAVIMRFPIKSHCSFGRPGAETGKVRAKRGNQLSTEAPAEFGATVPWNKKKKSYGQFCLHDGAQLFRVLGWETALYTAGNEVGSELSKY